MTDEQAVLAELMQAIGSGDEEILADLRENAPALYAQLLAENTNTASEAAQASHETKKPILVQRRHGESEDRALARFSCTPEALAAISISHLGQAQETQVDINALIAELESQAEAMRSEKVRQHSILASHSHTLDALFNHLLRLAQAHIHAGRFCTGEDVLKLAMRAQSQCRSTIETLAAMQKTIINQTNIAHGHQQVNNFPQNELLEGPDGERLDKGTARAAVRGDQALETMGEKHGPKDRGGEG